VSSTLISNELMCCARQAPILSILNLTLQILLVLDRMTVSDPVIVAVLDQVLQGVAGRQIEAFEKRCGELPLPVDLIEAAKLLKQQQ
jgi:hypothetical protein